MEKTFNEITEEVKVKLEKNRFFERDYEIGPDYVAVISRRWQLSDTDRYPAYVETRELIPKDKALENVEIFNEKIMRNQEKLDKLKSELESIEINDTDNIEFKRFKDMMELFGKVSQKESKERDFVQLTQDLQGLAEWRALFERVEKEIK